MIQFINGPLAVTPANVTSTGSSAPTPYMYASNAQVKELTIQASVTATTPAAGTFTAVAATDIITQTAHGYQTGLVLQVSNSGGALPTGLSAVTNYYVIRIDANTYYLATSYANAVAGTRIDITGAGTGTQTATPTTLGGMTAGCYGTVAADPTSSSAVWTLQDAALTTISATGTIGWTITEINYAYYQIQFVATSGNLVPVVTFQTLGDA